MTSPRRRRLSVEQRRAAILSAARGHFADTGYVAASTAAIAEASGSSPALVFHYFGSKAGLYTAVVGESLAALTDAQRAAEEALPAGASRRDRIRALLLIHLDHLVTDPFTAVTDRAEPAETLELRQGARTGFVAHLRQVLDIGDWPRHRYAVWGYVGFLEQACRRWREDGHPEDDRHPLVDAALGALEGALGDWGG